MVRRRLTLIDGRLNTEACVDQARFHLRQDGNFAPRGVNELDESTLAYMSADSLQTKPPCAEEDLLYILMTVKDARAGDEEQDHDIDVSGQVNVPVDISLTECGITGQRGIHLRALLKALQVYLIERFDKTLTDICPFSLEIICGTHYSPFGWPYLRIECDDEDREEDEEEGDVDVKKDFYAIDDDLSIVRFPHAQFSVTAEGDTWMPLVTQADQSGLHYSIDIGLGTNEVSSIIPLP